MTCSASSSTQIGFPSGTGRTVRKRAWSRPKDCAANNSTKSTPCLCADILGDWREEVIWRTTDGKELRIYTTTTPTAHRLHTLMHDPIYRLSVAYQNVGYNQPTQTGFYLGDGMSPPPRPAIVTKDSRQDP